MACSLRWILFFTPLLTTAWAGPTSEPRPMDRFSLACSQTLIAAAAARLEAGDSLALFEQLILLDLDQGRITVEEASFRINAERLSPLFQNRFLATIVAHQFREEGFSSPSDLKHALEDFEKRTEANRIAFVDQVVTSLTDVIGPSLWADSPQGLALRTKLGGHLKLSPDRLSSFVATWSELSQSSYREVRAFLWVLLHDRHNTQFQNDVAAAMGLRRKILRFLRIEFTPSPVPESLIPDLDTTTLQLLDADPTSAKNLAPLFDSLQASSIVFLVENYLDHYPPAVLKALQSKLGCPSETQAAACDRIQRRLTNLENLTGRINQLRSQLESIGKIEARYMLAVKRFLEAQSRFHQAVFLKTSAERLELGSDAEVKNRFSEIALGLKRHLEALNDSEATLPAEMALESEKKALAEIESFAARLDQAAETLLRLRATRERTSEWLNAHTKRDSVVPTDFEIRAIDQTITDIQRADITPRDANKLEYVRVALIRLITLKLEAEEITKRILRICLHISNAFHSDSDRIQAYELVRKAAILSKLRAERMEVIFTRVHNRVKTMSEKTGDTTLRQRLVDAQNWSGTLAQEEPLLSSLQAEQERLLSHDIPGAQEEALGVWREIKQDLKK